MKDEYISIKFDRNKVPFVDFDIIPLESILKKTYPDHDPRKLHRIQFYAMIIVTSGQGIHVIDFKEYPYQKGSILTIRKDQVHSFRKSNAKGYLIIFTEEFVLSHLGEGGARKTSELFNELLFQQHSKIQPEDQVAFDGLIEQILIEFNRSSDEHSPQIIRNLLQVLIRKTHRTRKVSPNFTLNKKYISQFLNFQKLVEENWQSHKTVIYYADTLNISSKTLNTIVQSVSKRTSKAIIDEISFINIKRFLINSDDSIKEIAYQTGFTEPTNFFKFFRRFSSLTPEEFRDQNRNT